jgi:hypothetical protein
MSGLQKRTGNSKFGETIEFRIVFIRQFIHLSRGLRARNNTRGKALPAGEILCGNDKAADIPVRSAALSCPQTSCPQGSFAAYRFVR